MEQMIEKIASLQDYDQYRDLHWEGSFEAYLQIVRERPQVTRNAFQRLHDMVVAAGQEEYLDNKKKIVRYNFFRDDSGRGRDAVFGLDIPLQRLVNVLKAASESYGPERRVLLLQGPVGSSKSTIARLLKKGIEDYSRTPDGALYSFDWINLEGTGMVSGETNGHANSAFPCPMHEEPLRLITPEWRERAVRELALGDDKQRVRIDGDLDPACRFIFKSLLERYKGNWSEMIRNHIKVKRVLLSEKDRVGIGTFQPKDEKNQDSTELTGDINYRKIAEYGSDSDPRAFNFDGEFNVANRGIVEFVEVLKLDVAFLYDLLGASQEHRIKPKKFAQTDIDEVIIGHTNEAEYKKLLANEFMEALRDRTIKIDVPYITRLTEEQRIYEKDFASGKVRGKHVAPHTLEIAAMWAVLTRLEDPKKHNLTVLQKLKLYDGRVLPGYTQDTVKELRKDSKREGMDGISPRFVQDKLSNALVRDEEGCLNPFMVMNELEKGLRTHSLITNEEQRKRFIELISVVKREYEDIVKNEVQRAISADEGEIAKLAANYVDNLRAYTLKERVKNRYTGRDEEPDERLMRSIEDKIDIAESRKDDFRREIMNFIGALALEGKKFTYDTNDRLRRALELKLFEDKKDTIKFTSVVANVVDRETQEKIDAVKTRMIRNYGYCEICAKNVLDFVSSIFARGDAKELSPPPAGTRGPWPPSPAVASVARTPHVSTHSPDPLPPDLSSNPFRHRAFVLYQLSRLFITIGAQVEGTAVALQVYDLAVRRHDAVHAPILLGYVGLVQFVPGILLSLPAGQIADRYDRKRILLVCYVALTLTALALFGLARAGISTPFPIFGVLAVAGIARAFSGPAASSIVARTVPPHALTRALAISSTVWQVATIIGPGLGALLYGPGGDVRTSLAYAAAAALWVLSLAMLAGVHIRGGATAIRTGAPSSETLLAGIRYVWEQKLVLGSISLDLFAVLFGGAVAMLPIFAGQIIAIPAAWHAYAFAILRGAMPAGASLMAILLSARPLRRHVGVSMFASVAIFGVGTIVFGLSRNLLLSTTCLFVIGAADMVSVVVRQTLVQACTPDEMRGRVSAVNLVFVGASNELGEFESGVTAQWLGPVRAVVLGGIGTVLVVAAWTRLFPSLRRVDRFPEAREVIAG